MLRDCLNLNDSKMVNSIAKSVKIASLALVVSTFSGCASSSYNNDNVIKSPIETIYSNEIYQDQPIEFFTEQLMYINNF